MKSTRIIVASALSATASAHAQIDKVRAPEPAPVVAQNPAQAPHPILADIILPIPSGGVWHPDVPPGMKIIDGDILVPLRFNPETDGFYAANLWPSGQVPYVFDPAFTSAESAQIVAAMNTWSALANVSFFARGAQTDYVYIQKSAFNNSAIGRAGNQQVINFAANQAQRVYIHELGHCLGFFHEHQRPDRGSYITVTQANAQAAFWGANFPIITTGINWGAYDFASVMHYDRCAFSIACNVGATCACASNQETMTALPAYNSAWNSVMGNANTQSYLDGITMRGLYSFPNDRWDDATYFGGQNATFQAPWNQTFPSLVNLMPSGGSLYFKTGAAYSAVGVWTKPMTINAPNGTVTLGN